MNAFLKNLDLYAYAPSPFAIGLIKILSHFYFSALKPLAAYDLIFLFPPFLSLLYVLLNTIYTIKDFLKNVGKVTTVA